MSNNVENSTDVNMLCIYKSKSNGYKRGQYELFGVLPNLLDCKIDVHVFLS